MSHSFKTKLYIHEVWLNIHANNAVMIDAIKTNLQPVVTSESPKATYSFELNEVSRTAPFFERIRFVRGEQGFYYRSLKDGDVLWWKYPWLDMVSQINRQKGRVRLWMTNPKKVHGFVLAQLLVLYPLLYLTRPLGWHFLHSAAVAKNNKALLLIGPSLAGKTSLTLAFARKGYKVLSDDTNILQRKNGRFILKSFPRIIQARHHTFRYIPELKSLSTSFSKSDRRRWVFPMEHIESKARRATAFPKMVIFLRYRARTRAKLEQMKKEECLERLQGDFFGFGVDKSFLLDRILLMGRFLKETPAFSGEYSRGNFREFISLLEQKYLTLDEKWGG